MSEYLNEARKSLRKSYEAEREAFDNTDTPLTYAVQAVAAALIALTERESNPADSEQPEDPDPTRCPVTWPGHTHRCDWGNGHSLSECLHECKCGAWKREDGPTPTNAADGNWSGPTTTGNTTCKHVWYDNEGHPHQCMWNPDHVPGFGHRCSCNAYQIASNVAGNAP